MSYPKPLIPRNDTAIKWVIAVCSVLVFVIMAGLPKMHIAVQLPFDPHVFALLNACINSVVTALLVFAFVAVRNKSYETHKKAMLAAIALSLVFLVSYIAHHIFAGETKFGGTGIIRIFYLVLLATHIVLAAFILPFILFTAYRSLSGDYAAHKKIARYTFPLWLYVAVTGVVIYLLISPYYS